MKVRHLLCLLFLLPTPAFAQQQFYGTTASVVQLSQPSTDIEKVPIKSGQVITSDNVRASIEALYATGHYSYIEADAVPAAGGTQLTFKVTPHTFFSTFRLDPGDLLERAISSSIRIPVGEKFSKPRVKTIIEETTQLLEDAGYFQAAVTPEYAYEANLVSVILHANVKSRARIGSLQLTGGEQTFTRPNELQHVFGLSTGDPFSADAVADGTTRIRQRFSDLGFLNTRVSAQRSFDPSFNVVNLTIAIEPGKFTLVEALPPLIENRQLRQLVPIYEEGAYDPDLVREGRARILEFLQLEGYFEATVGEPQEIQAPLDDAIQINFLINSGEKHKIGTIRILGNTFFSEADLQTRMKIRTPGLFDRGSFSPALLARDTAMIETLYRRAGFEEARVDHRTVDNPDHTVDVTIEIGEGTRSTIERLIFSGNTGVSEQMLRQHIRIKEGDIYAPAEAESARSSLMGMYFSLGYPDVRVDAAADRNAATGGKQVTFQIEEGPRFHIGRLMVAGNTRTADKIIRRESGMKEFQDTYNPELLLEAQRKLYATGLFNRVEIVPLDQDTGEYRTMLIQVEDAKPILVTPGVGAKEYAGPRVTLDVSHNNLFGLARSLSLRTRWGLHERQFQATYREPRLFNHELEGYGTLLVEKTDLRFFEARRLEFSIQALKKLSPYKNFFTTASYQNVNLQDIKLNPAVRRFPDLKGVIQIARLGTSFVGDWRKAADGTSDAINPYQGSYSRTNFEIASRVWGSEVNFVSLFNQSIYFKPVPTGVFAFSTRLGWKKPYGQDDELPIFERYFAGGSTTLRGFDLDEAGPPGGGQFTTLGNVEYRVPINLLSSRFGGFGGALFYDTGTVFERPSDFSLSAFTHSAGAGIRYQTPIGPVRFDVGFNLHPRMLVQGDGSQLREEKVQVFFTLGHAF